MKRLGRIWPELISFDNLLSAYLKARKGKQSTRSVAEFSLNLESELLSLQEQLADRTYKPGRYRLFTIYERKKRQTTATIMSVFGSPVRPPAVKACLDEDRNS